MYRKVATEMWTDQKFRALPAPGKLLFIYLFSNPHTHVGGIYYLPEPLILREAGLKQETLDTLWDTISGSGLACRDKENDIVWVVNMLKWQAKGEKILRAVSNHLKTLHNSFLIPQFLERYPSVKRFYRHRVSDTPSGTRTGVSQSGKQEQEYIPSTNVEGSEEVEGEEKTKKPKKAKQPEGVHAELFRAFNEAWRSRYGADYRFNRGKDGKHIKWLVDAVSGDAQEGRRVIAQYLTDEEAYIVRNRHPLSLLISGFNKYQAKPTRRGVMGDSPSMTVSV